VSSLSVITVWPSTLNCHIRPKACVKISSYVQIQTLYGSQSRKIRVWNSWLCSISSRRYSDNLTPRHKPRPAIESAFQDRGEAQVLSNLNKVAFVEAFRDCRQSKYSGQPHWGDVITSTNQNTIKTKFGVFLRWLLGDRLFTSGGSAFVDITRVSVRSQLQDRSPR